MKKPLFVLISTAFALASCGGAKPVSSLPSESESEPAHAVTWATPTGAPTLAFYDQGSNTNWLSTDTPAAIMPSAFAGNSYDALVFDGMAEMSDAVLRPGVTSTSTCTSMMSASLSVSAQMTPIVCMSSPMATWPTSVVL